MNKNKKIVRDKVIDFVKREYNRFRVAPSRRKIERRFNISLDTYFEKGLRGVFKLCKFKFSFEENKRKSRKEFYSKKRNRMRKEILKYFTQQIKKGINPTAANIRENFSVSLLTYFPGGIRELYKITKTNPPASLKDRKKLQKEIIGYIRLGVKKGYYPTQSQIDERFHTNTRCPIRKLYELAGVEYKRNPNPFLRYKKEKKLTDITQKLFIKLGYKIKRISIGPSRPCGADIILEDNRRRLIPVEIKAFQKFGKIGQAKNSPYIRNEFLQLKRYIKNLHSPYGYLVTSTDRKTFKIIPMNIKILFGKDLKRLLLQFKMRKELRDLEWIRNSSISYGKEKMKRKIANKLLNYVKNKINKGKYVGEREIFKKFKVKPESYFSEGMKEIYKKLNIDPESIPNYRMSRNFDKENFKKRIMAFVKKENKRGHFLTYKEIQRKFRCLPKLYFPGGIREIAKLAGIKYNRKFATKTPEERELIKQKIIRYFARRLKNGYYPGYREIRSEFHTDLRYYFKNIDEIYQKAGYSGPTKKTWKNSGK